MDSGGQNASLMLEHQTHYPMSPLPNLPYLTDMFCEKVSYTVHWTGIEPTNLLLQFPA